MRHGAIVRRGPLKWGDTIRRWERLKLLLAENSLSCAQIATIFEISERHAQRHVRLLIELGYPIEVDKEFSMYRIDPSRLVTFAKL